MKRKKILSSAISFILLLSITSTFTACSDKESSTSDVLINTDEVIEPLPDKFVDYTDPTNGVSYTYNNAYVMSFDNETDAQEMKDYNQDFYNQMFKNRRTYTNIYEDTQYYQIRTKKNEFNSDSSTFIYTVDRRADKDINISEISDEEYQTFSDNIKSQLASSMDEVTDDNSEKYVTFGDNEYLHFKYNFKMIGRDYVYEEFVFQLEDGTVCQFIFHCYASQYDFAFEYVREVLENMKTN